MRTLHILPGFIPTSSELVNVLYRVSTCPQEGGRHEFLALETKERVINSSPHFLALRGIHYFPIKEKIRDKRAINELLSGFSAFDRVVVYSYSNATVLLLRLISELRVDACVDLVCMSGEYFHLLNDLELGSSSFSPDSVRFIVVTGVAEKRSEIKMANCVWLPRLCGENSPAYFSERLRFDTERCGIQIGHNVSDRTHLSLLKKCGSALKGLDPRFYFALNYGWYFRRLNNQERKYIWQTRDSIAEHPLRVSVLNAESPVSAYRTYLEGLRGLVLDAVYPAAEELVIYCLKNSVPVVFGHDSVWAELLKETESDIESIDDLADGKVASFGGLKLYSSDTLSRVDVPDYKATLSLWRSFAGGFVSDSVDFGMV